MPKVGTRNCFFISIITIPQLGRSIFTTAYSHFLRNVPPHLHSYTSTIAISSAVRNFVNKCCSTITYPHSIAEALTKKSWEIAITNLQIWTYTNLSRIRIWNRWDVGVDLDIDWCHGRRLVHCYAWKLWKQNSTELAVSFQLKSLEALRNR